MKTISEVVSREYFETVLSRIPERPREIAEEQAIEFLKYVALMSLTQGRRIVVTPEVDDIWHEFIVQTVSYRNLCKSLPGERFINHESITPDAYEQRVGVSSFVEEFVQWIPDYVQSFGPFTENTGRHWTVIQFLRDELGKSLDEINTLGREGQAEARLPEGSPWRELGQVSSINDLFPVLA